MRKSIASWTSADVELAETQDSVSVAATDEACDEVVEEVAIEVDGVDEVDKVEEDDVDVVEDDGDTEALVLVVELKGLVEDEEIAGLVDVDVDAVVTLDDGAESM